MRPEQLLKRLETKDYAFLLGNGINRYIMRSDVDCSWKGLLKRIANDIGVIHNLPSLDNLESVSYTEYYSLLLFEAKEVGWEEQQVQKRICSIIHSWVKDNNVNKDVYKGLLNSLMLADRPVLTTNIDRFLDSSLQKNKSGFYFRKVFPICLYYSSRKQTNADDSFGVWHINGVIDYPESLRFGLIDYSKQIIRCGELLSERYEDKDSKPETITKSRWTNSTWLGILMKKPLCIVGLGLERDEVFLRSLLLRKVRWSLKGKKESVCKPGDLGWYCYTAQDVMYDDKRDLLRHMGIEPVMFKSYDDMYGKLFEVTKNHFANN